MGSRAKNQAQRSPACPSCLTIRAAECFECNDRKVFTSLASIFPMEISLSRTANASLETFEFKRAALASFGRMTANRNEASPVRL